MKNIISTFLGCLLVCAGLFSGVHSAFAQDVCPAPEGIMPPGSTIATAEQVENGQATLAQLVADY